MKAIIINIDKKSDLIFLLSLMKKLGIASKMLSNAQVKDWNLAKKIKTRMKSGNVGRSKIIKTLKSDPKK
jgi:hypothetical protein